MKRSEILSKLDELTQASPGTITGDEVLLDLPGWDSLTNTEFRMFAADTFGLELDGLEVDKCRTVQDLLGLLGQAVEPG